MKKYTRKKYMKILNKEDIMEIYLLMDKLNEIFHDPTRSEDINVIKKFGDTYYPTIHKLYYKTPVSYTHLQVGGMDDTVLHIAARNNSLNDALVFLQNGALIDLKGDLGYTPLHYACMFGNIEMVKLLLDNGSDKNIQNEFGENAVKMCIRDRHKSLENL